MSMVLSHPLNSTSRLIKLVQAALEQKYQNIFAFYKVRSINEVLYGYRKKSYIDLCDARTYSEQAQYMRRFYYHQNVSGKEELNSRLKLCAEYYSKNKMISHEYPMMIVTNTKSIFLRRHKQLIKVMNGEYSKDSEQENEQRLDFWDDDIDLLDDLDKSSLEEEESYEIEFQFDFDEEHNIYGPPSEEHNEVINLKTVKDSEVDHLIHDMTPEEKSVNDKTLKNISNKLSEKEESSISITPIETLSLKASTQFFKPSSFETSRDQISFARLSSKVEFPTIECSKPTCESTTIQSLRQEEQRKELQTRRRKIRQKAEDLLKRVRKEESECF